MNIVLMGPPGAGKGTQSQKLIHEFKVRHISTGDLFRKAVNRGTEFGRIAKGFIDKGELVPDNIVVSLFEDEISHLTGGFILDGFPRTLVQARALAEVLKKLKKKVDAVVYIKLSDELAVKRLAGRRTCDQCGHNFHVIFNPSKSEGRCDYCNGVLIQRTDDTEEAMRERLKVYHRATEEVIEYYHKEGSLITIDGVRNEDRVFNDIVAKIKNAG